MGELDLAWSMDWGSGTEFALVTRRSFGTQGKGNDDAESSSLRIDRRLRSGWREIVWFGGRLSGDDWRVGRDGWRVTSDARYHDQLLLSLPE
jgi:hypothetical protein